MIKLKIVEIKPYGQFILEDAKGRQHSLILEFYDTEEPKVGDRLTMSETLLDRTNPRFVQPYAFGSVENSHGRNAKDLSKNELVLIQTDKEKKILKRIYG